MLTINAIRARLTETTIDMEISVTASADSRGIFEVTVIGNDGNAVGTPPRIEGSCGHSLFQMVTMIPRDKLPVFVQASECSADANMPAGPVTVRGPLLGEDGPAQLRHVDCPPAGLTAGTPPNTNNQACIDAQNHLQQVRNQILTDCGQAAADRGRRDAFAAAAAAAFVAAAAFAAIGAHIPWVGVVLLIVAAVFLVAGIVLSILAAIQQNSLDAELALIDGLRSDYATDVGDLSNVCCPEFNTVPHDVPACP
jgi:hypothetical protein